MLARLAISVEQLLPDNSTPDFTSTVAAVWRNDIFGGRLVAYSAVDGIELQDLLHIDAQKQSLELNTRQFLEGFPANNALLWGARGTGKSSLIHALLNKYSASGLRLVEVNKQQLANLAELAQVLERYPFKFLIFCDDLSFEADDPAYKELKSALEGSIFSTAKNVVIYATSNRRHLLPEYFTENASAYVDESGELHHSEATEEKISLSDRFGLWLSFYPFKQSDYLDVVKYWLQRLSDGYDLPDIWSVETRAAALQWALARGVRSGRTAEHFARHWVGINLLKENEID